MPEQRRSGAQLLGKSETSPEHGRGEVCNWNIARLRVGKTDHFGKPTDARVPNAFLMGFAAAAAPARFVAQENSAEPDADYSTRISRANSCRQASSALPVANAQIYLGS